jgi:hypothetical protein
MAFVPFDLPLSELLELRNRLIRARANDVREISDQNGESITYKSDREMAAALAYIESLISARRSGGSNVIKFKTSKGT